MFKTISSCQNESLYRCIVSAGSCSAPDVDGSAYYALYLMTSSCGRGGEKRVSERKGNFEHNLTLWPPCPIKQINVSNEQKWLGTTALKEIVIVASSYPCVAKPHCLLALSGVTPKYKIHLHNSFWNVSIANYQFTFTVTLILTVSRL